ncbi:hypothetical protein ACSQ67_014557 [Phaseolus vulgaris]
MSTELMNEEQLHVVMFPFLAFGHISPFVQLSNKLFSHGVRITFLSAESNISRIRSSLNLNPAVNVIPLQFPNGISNTADLPPHLAANLVHALDLTQPQVKSLLLELKPHYVFFDFAQHWLPKIASQLGIKSVHFSVYSAISDSYITVPSRFSHLEGTNITFEDLKSPHLGILKTPMFPSRPLRPWTSCSSLRDLVNTSLVMSGFCKALPSRDVLEEKWSKWLDTFPAKSVILCSFGSETFLNDDQIRELASGLELSGLPFILVLNFPSDLSAQSELERTLPKGFLERVKDRAVVHTGWFQQQLVLKHPSVGCYVCHAGFSSVIEAMVNECQLVLLPFKEDDREPGKQIRENHMKWSKFLSDKEIQNNFITNLIAQLKSMA